MNIPKNITLVAAVKYADFEQIKKILTEGSKKFPGLTIENLGWNTVQHFLKTAPLLEKHALLKHCKNHFIGHLQTKKVAQLLQHNIELIHSVDSEKLLQKINAVAVAKNKIQKILLQINTDPKKKSGFTFAEIENKIEEWQKLPHIKIEGLMTIPPPTKNPDDNRKIFKQIKQFAGKIGLHELSMGMSDDYQIAIEEGATIVRLGRLLFKGTSKIEDSRVKNENN